MPLAFSGRAKAPSRCARGPPARRRSDCGRLRSRRPRPASANNTSPCGSCWRSPRNTPNSSAPMICPTASRIRCSSRPMVLYSHRQGYWILGGLIVTVCSRIAAYPNYRFPPPSDCQIPARILTAPAARLSRRSFKTAWAVRVGRGAVDRGRAPPQAAGGAGERRADEQAGLGVAGIDPVEPATRRPAGGRPSSAGREPRESDGPVACRRPGRRPASRLACSRIGRDRERWRRSNITSRNRSSGR